MALHLCADQVRAATATVGGTTFTTTAVHGNASSLMLATRPDGYHSDPHWHECEQINLLQSGTLWIFVEDRAFLLRPGDVLRIPARAVHWAWNRSGSPCTLLEVHSPGMQYDPTVSAFAIGLYDEGEVPRPAGTPVNEFLPEDSAFDRSVAEKQVR